MLPKHNMSTPPTTSDLHQTYQTKLALYDSKVTAAIATNDTSVLPELRTLNAELATLLDQILSETTNLTPLSTSRAELVAALARVQQDATHLRSSSDTLERLRRMRESSGAPRSEVLFYLGAFLLVCLGILAMLFMGSSQSSSVPTMTSSIPPSTAPLV